MGGGGSQQEITEDHNTRRRRRRRVAFKKICQSEGAQKRNELLPGSFINEWFKRKFLHRPIFT